MVALRLRKRQLCGMPNASDCYLGQSLVEKSTVESFCMNLRLLMAPPAARAWVLALSLAVLASCS
jgi:hypothetical protein